KWYRRPAEKGKAEAQDSLGTMYAEGRGVPKDDKEAVKWYRLAAAQGNAHAQTNLGGMYANGQGVPQDYAELAQGLDEATALNQQVIQLYNQGRFSEALPLAQRALAMREEALGPDHPDVATSLNKPEGAPERSPKAGEGAASG